MTLDFQENLLRFLFQDASAKSYAIHVDEDIFDRADWKQIFKIWRAYLKKYESVPSRVNFNQFFERIVTTTKFSVKEEVADELRNVIDSLYTPLDDDTRLIKDEIILYARKKKIENLAFEIAEKIDTAEDKDFEAWEREFKKANRLKEVADNFERNRGGFLFRDYNRPEANANVKPIPIFLNSINRMTSAKGFHPPQVISFIGGAKKFKTGLLLNIGVKLALHRVPVLYIDTENGMTSIKARAKQVLLKCNRNEVNKYKPEFNQIAKRAIKMGTDFVCHFLPAGSTLADIEEVLEYYRDIEGFVPKAIIHDYAHNYKPVDKSIKERRLQIQDVYKNLTVLNEKWNTFSFTVSPNSGDANDRWVMTEKDFGEDKSIAYNVHAGFAICRVEAELLAGTAHIIPVTQRDGLRYDGKAGTTCAIRIDEENMFIEELNAEAYLVTMRDHIHDNPAKTKVKKPKSFPTK